MGRRHTEHEEQNGNVQAEEVGRADAADVSAGGVDDDEDGGGTWVGGGLAKAVETAAYELIEVHRVVPAPPPEVPEPDEWVHTWLKAKGMAQYSGGFIEQGLV